ncbi:MAG: hypothetical protein PVH61_23215 [Candidatus Aminicenantes bacterium]|jgi:hypothetical protein
MKVAIVYNRQQKNVINLFAQLNKEKIGEKTIPRILNALKKDKHQAIALEGDKELIHRLEEFMPRVLKGERPGIVFNVSYGIQGEARYTHVPSIKGGYSWTQEKVSERPPMKEKRKNQQFFKKLSEIACKWELPLDKKSSLWPSTAGLVPDNAGFADIFFLRVPSCNFVAENRRWIPVIPIEYF